MLDLILTYSRRYPNLKSQLFSFLYNLLLKGELQVVKPEDVKPRQFEICEGADLQDFNCDARAQLFSMSGSGARHGSVKDQ